MTRMGMYSFNIEIYNLLSNIPQCIAISLPSLFIENIIKNAYIHLPFMLPDLRMKIIGVGGGYHLNLTGALKKISIICRPTLRCNLKHRLSRLSDICLCNFMRGLKVLPKQILNIEYLIMH